MVSMSPDGSDEITRLIVALFRLNGALVAAGDRLVADLGLTSSRWQVLGAVAAAPAPLPMASIARTMGLTRQGVRLVVGDLLAAGLVQFADNPHHRRARLVVPTPEGARLHAAALDRQAPWSQDLASGIAPGRIAEAADLLHTLLGRLSAVHKEPPADA